MLPPVDILLATFIREKNPEQLDFFRQQIHSLLMQDYAGPLRILIRDDGSTLPGALDVITSYAGRHDNVAIEIVREDGPPNNKSFIGNFERLMQHSARGHAEYVFFCDQDDIWRKDKISTCVHEMGKLETEHSKTSPLMVHHHARLCNGQNEIIDGHGLDQNDTDQNTLPFYRRSTRDIIHPNLPFSFMLARIPVPGFTIGINSALRDASLPFPDSTVSHDHHVTLTAKAMGAIAYIGQDLADYRIHASNTSKPHIPRYDPLEESRMLCEREWDNSEETIKWRLKRVQRLVDHCRYAYDMITSKQHYPKLENKDEAAAALFSQFPFMIPEERVFAAAAHGISTPDIITLHEGLLDMPQWERPSDHKGLVRPEPFRLAF